MNNIFSPQETQELIQRIEKLTPESQALWGKMSVSQMLAHLNVMYELVYEPEKHKAPGPLMKILIKMIAKKTVVSETPYSHNMRTAPAFLIKENRDFEKEKNRLIAFIHKTRELGEYYFEGKESFSFGKLSKQEWNNMFAKHLDHHLKQFGV